LLLSNFQFLDIAPTLDQCVSLTVHLLSFILQTEQRMLIGWLSTEGNEVNEVIITADVRTHDEHLVDEFISRIEGSKVFGMDDVLSHYAEGQRQPGTTCFSIVLVDLIVDSDSKRPISRLFDFPVSTYK